MKKAINYLPLDAKIFCIIYILWRIIGLPIVLADVFTMFGEVIGCIYISILIILSIVVVADACVNCIRHILEK